MRKKIYVMLALLLLCTVTAAGAYNWYCQGIRFVHGLGPGINLGNSLDVVRVREHKPEADITDYETFWGNPPIAKDMFDSIAQKGFRTVRIPVNWGEHLDERGKIEAEWMSRVREVVDWALDAGLYVILDTHHEAWLIPTADSEERTTEQLCSIWAQIAGQFKDYDEHLLFEGMNEPRLENSKEEWTAGTEEMQQIVNRLNQAFVSTVRETAGENKKRWLLVSAYCTSAKREALQALELPDDPHLIVSVHAYLPYQFTLADDGNDSWSEGNTADTEEIDELMEILEELFLDRKIPVVITEFGCQEKPEELQRMAWTAYYLKKAQEKGIPCLWWDNGKECGLFDRTSLIWKEELTEVLLGQ